MNTAFRPLSIGELLDRSFSIYRQQFATFLVIAAVPSMFFFAGRILIGLLQANASDLTNTYSFFFRLPAPYMVAWLAFMILNFILGVAAEGAMINAVAEILMARQSSATQAFAAMRGKVARAFGVYFTRTFLAGLALLLLIVPGVLLWLRWSIAVPVAVLEGTGVSDSCERSAFLTEDARGRIFLIMLVYVTIFYGLSFGLGFPLGVVRGMMAAGRGAAMVPLWYSLGILISGVLVSILVTPIINIALTLQYYDGRIRKEAFDLQLLIQHASGAVEAASV